MQAVGEWETQFLGCPNCVIKTKETPKFSALYFDDFFAKYLGFLPNWTFFTVMRICNFVGQKENGKRLIAWEVEVSLKRFKEQISVI